MALSQGLNRIDALMLSFFGVSANLIGVYTLVSDLTQLIRVAKMAFSGVYSPLVAKYRALGNRLGVLQALDDTSRKSSSISLALLLLLMCTWPLFIFDANETWTDSSRFPWLLCAGPLMSAFFGLCGNTLLMFGHSRLLLLNAMGAGTLNVLLNYLMIPELGLLGAALATAISNVGISIAQVIELRHIERIQVRWAFYRRTLLAGFVPVAVVFGLTAFVLPVTGPFGDWPAWVPRTALALAAVLLYFGLQWGLPGKHPFRALSKKKS
jgi:O-antigen/teichoic acid export membrane protein